MKLKFLNFYWMMNEKSKDIRADENRRRRSVFFAILSIILDIAAVGLVIGGYFLFLYGIGDAWTSLTILAIIPLGLGIGLMVLGLGALVWSLIAVIMQIALNRGVMTWIALVLFLGTVGLGVVAVIYAINNL